jgi:hypothetical protein
LYTVAEGLRSEIVRVEAQDSQQPREAAQVAVDQAFQVGHATAPPIAETVGTQQAHADQHIDRPHDIAPGEQVGDDALDPLEHRIVPEVMGRDALSHVASHKTPRRNGGSRQARSSFGKSTIGRVRPMGLAALWAIHHENATQ